MGHAIKEKENALRFLDWMSQEGTPFSKVEKELGKFNAVIFFLRTYEDWLDKNKK